MLRVAEHIKEHGLESLSEFGIKVKDYDDFVVLNYDQIESPRNHEIADECRGLILRKDAWQPLCWPFKRFYNYGECGEVTKTFPFSGSMGFEKLDGSLINIWWNPFTEKWTCATRGMAFAEGDVRQGIKSFADLVDQALGMPLHDYMEQWFNQSSWDQRYRSRAKNHTFMCELVTPENRIVTPYEDYRLVLIGMRSLEEGYEINWEGVASWAEFLHLPLPKVYHFNSVEEVLTTIESLGGMDEGFVVCSAHCVDEDYGWVEVRRLKMKNPSWCAIHHLRDNGLVGAKRMAVLVIGNDEEEYLSYFPEDRPLFEPMIEAREKMHSALSALWGETKDLESQKDFALAVKDTPLSAIMFSMRKGQEVSSILEMMNDERKEQLLSQFM